MIPSKQDLFDSEKMYTYIKGYAMALSWNDTIAALAFARRVHQGQTRKNGQPYIVHPLTIACHAIALGIKDDTVIASALLHDTVEDCGVKVNYLPVSSKTQEAVRLLTHVKGEPLEPYYRAISENETASIVKLLDRCDNVSSMAGVFSVEKTKSYIDETRNYVLPLLRQTKDNWPIDGNALFTLKYHITSVINGIANTFETIEKET